MSNKIILSCDSCGTRNYSVPARSNQSAVRLSLKKFCSRCNAHTIHKQTA